MALPAVSLTTLDGGLAVVKPSSAGISAKVGSCTGGTANTTLAAVGATDASDVSSTINNNFADIAAQLALIKADVAVALSRQ